jgi:site-specific recombinase XerD
MITVGDTVTELEPATPELPAPLALPRRRDQDPYWVYLARFTGESQRAMRGCLDRAAAILTRQPPQPGLGALIAWEGIRYAHAVKLRSMFIETWPSASHVNKHLSALRGVLKECWRLGLMSAEEYQRARDVDNVKGTRQVAGRNLGTEEIAALLAACLADARPLHGIRDAAIVAMLQSTGVRRAEAAGALIECYDHGERSLKVIGKGNKERTVYFHKTAVPYIDRWLACVGTRRGPVFRGIDRWANISTRPLSPRAVGYLIDERRQQAAVAAMSAHDFRRTFIGDVLDAGGDLAQAQVLAGHSSPTTTALYDRRPGRQRRDTVDKLRLPPPDSGGVPRA